MSIAVERGPQKVRAEDKKQLEEKPVSYGRVLALFTPHRTTIVFVVALIVATSALTVVQPFLVKETVDNAIPNQNVQLLLWLVAAMIGLVALTQVIGVVQTWMSAKVGQKIMHSLRLDVFTNLQRQSMTFFTTTKTGEIQSRLTNDIAGMRSIVTSTATSIASNVTVSVATIIAMVALSPTLSLLSLLVLPPSIWLTRKVALVRKEMTAKQQDAMARMQSTITESLSVSGVRLAKTLGFEQRTRDSFGSISEELIDLELKSQLAGRWRMASMQIIFATIPALVYLVAGLPVTSNGITIGTLIAFSTLQSQIFRPLTGLLNIGAQWISSMALFSRIFEYLDMQPEITEPVNPRDNEIADSSIAISNVSYRYPNAEEYALTDVSIDIPAGTTVALVGHTGSGKSTLANLVTRLADPTSGSITIGGVDLKDISFAARTNKIGVVSQETYLAHDSIRANLQLANPEASEAEMWQALEAANVDLLIASLPDGLDTIVGSRGYRFSGGEQQRIALARTILADPEILVLDEATSALDNETERAVHQAITTLGKDRTVIMIAHRLSTVENADQICVMDEGRLIESGTHSDLLKRNGIYSRLVGTMNVAA